jgi:hypothetical protein
MTYELWDTAIGVGIAEFADEFEMRALVRTLLTHHGSGQDGDLDVLLMDEGVSGGSLTGQELLAWVNAEPKRSDSGGSIRQDANDTSLKPVAKESTRVAKSKSSRAALDQ